MDGLSRWDLVLWFVVAYAAVMILVRLMLNRRETVLRRCATRLARRRDGIPWPRRPKNAATPLELIALGRRPVESSLDDRRAGIDLDSIMRGERPFGNSRFRINKETRS